MKTNTQPNTIRATVLAAGLLATALISGPAKAQGNLQGKFTLPQETRWGQAVLPAGDYQLTFSRDATGKGVVIRDAKSGRIVAFESIQVREDSAGGESALVIGNRGTQRVVYSLQLADLGESFVYERAAHRREAEEARQTQTVPVLVAKK
jgi:hypothetical protein